ncbi:MAG: serine hydrolase [Rikenellaceae bacterium]|nr:serine hydrolase [Rikenellaceae bacterium]
MMRLYGWLLAVLLPVAAWASDDAAGAGHPRPLASAVSATLDSIMEAGVARHYYPGATLTVGTRRGVVYDRQFGDQDYESGWPVKADDLYDIASCTKVVSTTLAVMWLYDNGRIDLNARVGAYLPQYGAGEVGKIAVRELLTHTSGLGNVAVYSLLTRNAKDGERLFAQTRSEAYPHRVDKNLFACCDIVYDSVLVACEPLAGYRCAGGSVYVSPEVDSLLRDELAARYSPSRRGKYVYSDLNFLLLQQIVEQIAGESLAEVTRPLFDRMGMHDTGYCPLEWATPDRIVPTEHDMLLRRGTVRGYVHDELAAVCGGVSGNAGIFSCGRDLARYCEMLLRGGMAGDDRILSEETVLLFTSSPLSPRGIYRGLGFDKRAPGKELGGRHSFGHTGYTGTMIWIDRDQGFYMVFLSNRVNPSRANTGLISSNLRTTLWDVLEKYYDK